MVKSAEKVVVARLTLSDWQALWQASEDANDDGFDHNLRHPATTKVKRVSLICAGNSLVALGLAQTKWMSTKLDTLVRFSSVRELHSPLSLDELTSGIAATLRHYAEAAFSSGGVLPPTSGSEVLAVLKRLRPEAEGILHTLFGAQPKSEFAASPHSRQLLLEQRDALTLGLEAAGLDSRAIVEHWQPSGDAPFLLGLPDTWTSEAALIRHDFSHFDEWANIGGTTHDVVEFVDPHDVHRKVTVIYADKEPLEEQLGTDLVYFRRDSPGYVAVQYKRLKREPTQGEPLKAVYRPDKQLTEEILRMRKIQLQTSTSSFETWRLSPDPFYVKLCDEHLLRADGKRLVPGMYFPLGLFEMLLESPKILGPGGGKAIAWNNAERYLSNGQFLELLKHGWIGSVGATTEVITKVIRESMDRQRSVTLVIDDTDQQKAKPIRRS
ncbi:hypothetical protein ACSBOX_04475 [Arthrobacter sp. KN11-1C]|uniref:hypothetical protein n=1 Tax=Arthrobacter sp. KN11-1C TaxID=3445774 RepID=UPI003FA1080A